MSFSLFLKVKSETTENMITFFKWTKDRHTPVNIIRLDNSGENVKLKESTKDMNIKYEFTAPNTPQQNGRVERKFLILCDYMRSMINKAILPTHLRQKMWAEAAHHATDVMNGIITTQNQLPPYTAFYKADPPYYKHLHTFGELAVIATNTNKQINTKMDNRGILGLYLGRVSDHQASTYRFYNVSTIRIILS
jgi:hypothetical protein